MFAALFLGFMPLLVFFTNKPTHLDNLHANESVG